MCAAVLTAVDSARLKPESVYDECVVYKKTLSRAQDADILTVVSLLPLLSAPHGGLSVDVTMKTLNCGRQNINVCMFCTQCKVAGGANSVYEL
jgi:hypothetical protein